MSIHKVRAIIEEFTDSESCPSCGEDWPRDGGEHTEDCRWHELCEALRSLDHPAAAEQPAPTGKGVDVILDLVKAVRRDDPRLRCSTLYHMALHVCLDEHGWDLGQALMARREKGIAKYGTPLRTHNGRSAAIDLGQEVLDAFVYEWQEQLEKAP